ncbi:MAG TPA: 1,6-anhydro-N-acetylmuramyl-L-alanine amidase AmpD [Gammaproteobacteria bacterium]|nr:1,6-anhydro-N-acetylmuramyl-L-alanine amidase AmpD [Gammaproteobacteria bacterium]
MRIDAATGWIEGVRRIESPNFDARPSGCKPELIVIHGISLPPGEFGGNRIDELFCNALDPGAHPYFEQICHLRVSSHVLITRLGALTQYVSFRDRAWHAGESSYCGRRACNDFSIGIELEGTDDSSYEPAQYERLAQLVRGLRASYASLEQAELVGHSDIAPGRKTDPGPHFDWDRLRRELLG